jgi:hypothetical protein
MDVSNLIMNQYQNFDPLRFSIELTYTSLIMFLFIFLYLKTNNLSKFNLHKGLKYFRLSLLFFFLAFLSRTIFYLTRLFFIHSDLHVPGRIISFISILVLTYTVTLAIGFLIYSLNWKKLNYISFIIIIHLIYLISATSFYLVNNLVYLIIIQLLMTGYLLFLVKKTKTKILYTLISLFWIFNMTIFYSRNLIGIEIKAIFQILSLITLTYIIYRVLKWTK